jgi:hypothetical protein
MAQTVDTGGPFPLPGGLSTGGAVAMSSGGWLFAAWREHVYGQGDQIAGTVVPPGAAAIAAQQAGGGTPALAADGASSSVMSMGGAAGNEGSPSGFSPFAVPPGTAMVSSGPAQIAARLDGTAAMAFWAQSTYTEGHGDVMVSLRPPGGTFVPWNVASGALVPEMYVPPAVGVTSDGRVVVAWVSGNPNGFGPGTIAATVGDPTHGFAAPTVLSTAGVPAEQPQIATDGHGHAVIVWQEDAPNSVGGTIRAALLPAGSAIGASLTVPGADALVRDPRVGMSAQGRIEIAFDQLATSDSAWGVPTVVSADFGGAFSAPLAPGGDVPDTGQVSLAVDPTGEALLAWNRELPGPTSATAPEAAFQDASGNWDAGEDLYLPCPTQPTSILGITLADGGLAGALIDTQSAVVITTGRPSGSSSRVCGGPPPPAASFGLPSTATTPPPGAGRAPATTGHPGYPTLTVSARALRHGTRTLLLRVRCSSDCRVAARIWANAISVAHAQGHARSRRLLLLSVKLTPRVLRKALRISLHATAASDASTSAQQTVSLRGLR